MKFFTALVYYLHKIKAPSPRWAEVEASMLYRDPMETYLAVPNPVHLPDLLQRICVRPPYFALEQLSWQAGVFTASASSAARECAERSPMPGAEISRHAAIAGLCAVALAQPDDQRRYYLAQEARYTGVLGNAPAGSAVRFSARLLELDKRRAQAAITAQVGGETIATVEVLYTVLNDSAFSRLFRNRQQPGFTGQELTALAPLPAGSSRKEGSRLIREVGSIPAETCAGHFDGYPAMPVAILMGQLAELAGQAFAEPFHISAASVQASDFCWAGEAARFEVTPLELTPRGTVFDCAAYAGERPVGQMRLVLDRLPRNESRRERHAMASD
ncbi:MAG: hypothetical protein ACR2J4_03950 [Deinococcus sp.]